MREKSSAKNTEPCKVGCACSRPVDRRTFGKVVSAGLLGMLAPHFPVMAGPFETVDFENLVPADKNHSAEWIASLYARGVPQV